EKLKWGQKVQVIRVTEVSEDISDETDFVLDWKRRTTKNLRSVEIQHGYRQKSTWTVKRTFHDGREAQVEESPRKVKKTEVGRLVFLSKKGHPEKIYDLSKAKKISLIATAYWK